MSRWTLIAGWLLVLVVATTVTWQIVSAADDRVSERPLSPLNVAAPQLAIDTTTLSSTATTVSTAPAQTEPTSTTQAAPSPSTTTATPTPTTSAPPTPPTTAPPSQWDSRTVQTKGGSVVLSYRPGEVILQAAAPAPGFQAEVEQKGPPKVHVEFESEALKIELQAEWRDGDLAVDISESSHD